MSIEDPTEANQTTREVWNQNAEFWDQLMGEGNDWVNLLIWPAVSRLLELEPGQRALDVACGNGLTSRRMAAEGAEVVAFDFAEEMIARARNRPGSPIDYRVVDGTDETALLGLGEGRFDAALCNMALFDMAEITSLFSALARLLRPGGRFVFSVLHPCFNNPHAVHVAEMADRAGQMTTVYSMKVSGYMTPTVERAIAMPGQPRVQLLFHRPLHLLLGAAFEAGFVLDGLEERAFPPETETGTLALSWSGKFSEIPPVLIARVCSRAKPPRPR